jgi:endonuclease/exonuclease/phosphatase family metal-dependent hydrolase
MGFNVPWHRLMNSGFQGQKIRVLSCNVHRGELDVPKLDQYVLATDPDVVVLQDYAGWDESEVLKEGWRTLRLRDSFIASKFPITHVENLHLAEVARDEENDEERFVGSATCFDLQTPGGLVHVLNVHLASPHTGLTALVKKPGLGIWKLKNNARRRSKESQTVAEYVAGLKAPVILAGDFNMLWEGPMFRTYFGGFGDAFRGRGWGYGYTHFSRVSQLRLDHVLYTPELDCAAFEIGPDCRTPHRPIMADLVLRPMKPD